MPRLLLSHSSVQKFEFPANHRTFPRHFGNPAFKNWNAFWTHLIPPDYARADFSCAPSLLPSNAQKGEEMAWLGPACEEGGKDRGLPLAIGMEMSQIGPVPLKVTPRAWGVYHTTLGHSGWNNFLNYLPTLIWYFVRGSCRRAADAGRRRRLLVFKI